MTTYQILFWHDIPTQVRARDGGKRVGRALPPRFMETVDRAAMAAGITDSDEYTAHFHWNEPVARAGTPEEVADAVVAELDSQYLLLSWRTTADALKKKQQ